MKRFLIPAAALFLLTKVVVFCQTQNSSAVYEVRVNASTSSTQVPLNREVTLVIQVSWTGGMDTVSVKEIEDPSLTNFEITGTSAANRIEASPAGKKSIREITYTLKPHGLGMGYIEPAAVAYQVKSTGKSYTVSTRRLSVKVVDAVPEPGENKFPYVWVLAFILLTGGSAAFYLIRKKGKAAENKKTPEDDTPLEERSLLELKNVIKEKTTDSSTMFADLISVFRKYLRAEFNISAMETTSSELIKLLEENGVDEKYITRFDKIFSRADIVKFSGEKALQTDVDDAFAQIEMFIEARLNLKKEKSAPEQAQKRNIFGFLIRKKTE